MRKVYKILMISLVFALFAGQTATAGNKDRVGEAGAGQLLINPWVRSSGLGGSNSAYISGLEAQFLNVAGIARTRSTELIFAHTSWLVGTGTSISSFGITQKLGKEGGVLGLSVMSLSFGDIPITTVSQPEGGIGTFSPKQSNVNISYAKAFSNSIYAGVTVKIVSESTSSTKASTVAIDAGIQYVTGKHDQFKFGVALKNVGPNMKYTGDGLSFRGFVPGQVNALTVEQRSAGFELPTLIRIGASYDLILSDNIKLIPSYTFTSNSFTNDQHSVGVELRWSKYLVLRGGYTYENDLLNTSKKINALTGFAMGISIEAPFNKGDEAGFSIDYAYQTTNPFAGVHSIGVRLHL